MRHQRSSKAVRVSRLYARAIATRNATGADSSGEICLCVGGHRSTVAFEMSITRLASSRMSRDESAPDLAHCGVTDLTLDAYTCWFGVGVGYFSVLRGGVWGGR